MLAAIGHALMMSFAMTWEILWALILGFTELSCKDSVRSASHRRHWTVDSELALFSQILPDDNQRSSRSA